MFSRQEETVETIVIGEQIKEQLPEVQIIEELVGKEQIIEEQLCEELIIEEQIIENYWYRRFKSCLQ